MASLATPEEVSSELSADRLAVVAELMLDVLAKAIAATSTQYDCAYSRGALSWAWIKNALLALVRSRSHSWLTIRHAGNDLVIGIGSYSVRFFIDDHQNPRKPRVLNPTDGEAFQLSIDFGGQPDVAPVLWRFIVERALSDDDDNRVFFVGYNSMGEVVAKWQFTDSVRSFRTTDSAVPPAAKLPPIALAPIYDDILEDEVSSSESLVHDEGFDNGRLAS